MRSTLKATAQQWPDIAPQAVAPTRPHRPSLYLASARRPDGTIVTYDAGGNLTVIPPKIHRPQK